MKKTTLRLLVMCGLTVSLVACGSDSTPGPDSSTPADTFTPDTGGADADTSDTGGADTTTPDTGSPDTTLDTTTPDTGSPDTTLDTTTPDTNVPDTNTPDTNVPDTNTTDTTAPTCSRNGFAVTESYFDYDDEYGDTIFGVWNDTAELVVGFYDYGNGSPLTGVGVYPIGANVDDQNYETCETCVLIYADCGAEECDKIFYATSGSIEVTAIDQVAGTVTAKLKDIVAVEVTIAEDYVSTPVPNGETYCVDAVDVNYN